jgi:NADH-quinone oxidoreductase subunit H
MRSAAQAVSYEVPLVLSLLGPVMIAGTMSMGKLVEAQSGSWFGLLPKWFVFPQMVAFLVYFTCSLAECNRLPFDIPEAESELVAGFHVEYSGMRFAIFFLAEYANMFVVAAIATTMFLGGWNGPWIPVPGLPRELIHGLFGLFWFQVKCYFMIFVMMWLRWTLARLRWISSWGLPEGPSAHRLRQSDITGWCWYCADRAEYLALGLGGREP